MAELYFLRHGRRADHANLEDEGAEALCEDFQSYDPSLASSAIEQVELVANEISSSSQAFGEDKDGGILRKNIFVHFSPYLRCCQTADLLVTKLKKRIGAQHPKYKIRYQLLGDFALSEWIHEKMSNKPPFVDSQDAYHMYTPNIKLLANRSACSNFRPTNTLGPFNGPNLSYSAYQANCKKYFQKLLATYDKPNHLKNQDIVIVVSHGYAINNFMSYFINHPIFEEIPEAEMNYARRVKAEGESNDVCSDDIDTSQYHWKLIKDALGLVEREHVDSFLNLETDIVYYKTNFFKKDDFDENMNLKLKVPAQEKPRASFRLSSSSRPKSAANNPVLKNYNPICPAAKDWTPQGKHFAIKSDFNLKAINDESFRKSFSLSNHPAKPISPEVSPTSEPTRSNSVIDLSKLVDNNDIYKPMKLKYSTAYEVPVHQLNSKVNSQVNLAQYQREYGSSNDNSAIDLPKYLTSLQSSSRKRLTSNPIYATVSHNAKDSYFPLNIVGPVSSPPPKRSDDLLISVGSGSPIDEDTNGDLQSIKEHRNKVRESPQPSNNPLLRSKSLNHKRAIHNKGSTSLLAKYQQHQNNNESDDSDSTSKHFALAFNNKQPASTLNKKLSSSLKNKNKHHSSNHHHHHNHHHRSLSNEPGQNQNQHQNRSSSVKFIPSVLNGTNSTTSSPTATVSGTPKALLSDSPRITKLKPFFYSVDSEDSTAMSVSSTDSESTDSLSSSDDDDDDDPKNNNTTGKSNLSTHKQNSKKKDQFIWFGQNR